jgi:hypothetical protein
LSFEIWLIFGIKLLLITDVMFNMRCISLRIAEGDEKDWRMIGVVMRQELCKVTVGWVFM